MRWRYSALDHAGRSRSGRIEAESEMEAADRLAGEGLSLLSLSKLPAKRRAFSYEKAGRLAGELARLSSAGIALETALTLAADAETSPSLGEDLRLAAKKLSKGDRPERAFAHFEGPAGAMLATTIAAGERAGDLPHALNSIAPILQSTARFRSKLLSAMLYPAAVMATSLGVLAVFFGVVVPSLRPVLEQSRAPEDGIHWLIRVADAIPAVLVAILLVFLVGLAALRMKETRLALGRWRDRVLLSSLGFGLVAEIETAVFARLFGALVSSGVPLGEAAAQACRSLGNEILRERLLHAGLDIQTGRNPVTALADVLGRQNMVVQAAEIGIRTGQAGPLIAEAGQVLGERAEIRLERVSALASPAIIILVGALIGALVISLFSSLAAIPDAIS